MYIIFNYESGQFQFGFRSLKDLGLQHGLLLSGSLYEKLDKYFYIQNKNIFLLNHPFFLIYDENILFYDCRFCFKNKFIKKFFLFLINIYILFIKYKGKFNMYYNFLFIILIIVLFKFLFVGYFIYKKPESKEKFQEWSYEEWASYFKNSKIAYQVAQNKFDFLSLEIPEIKGISKFRVLPLNSSSSSVSNFTSQIALPYKSFISLKKDKSIKIKNPVFFCREKTIYFFEFDQSDEILIFNEKNFIGNNYYFTIYKDVSMQKNICFDELNAKHQIEE